CVARLVEATRAAGGVMLLTADHGNADQMFDQKSDGSLHARTSHSLNRVPLVIYDPRLPNLGPRLRPPADAGLTHLAATSLELLGFSAPEHFRPSLLAPTT
ncbi:MAG: 2,3-bisphosphoglycerate-independent phosphoglycerate mutase, partial [Nannocystaceae bacterium]